MSVSVIMPVHGKVEDYGKMLENIGTHLSNQSVLPHEWILVCDSDSTWLHQISLPSFTKIIVSPQNSASQKRNMGLDEAGGEFILLLDSDQWPETPDLISECITVAQQGYDILLIPEKFSNSGP